MKLAIAVVAVVTIFRVAAAAVMPLNDDEMYYWVWSKHLAYGYTDHPPAIAWLIALTSSLGKSPIAIRCGFIACLAIAPIALGGAVLALGGNAAGANAAAIIFTLIPQPDLLIGMAKPDPPYLMCWALALLFAARAQPLQLGLALAGAALSRFFGWALVVGIVAWAFTPVAIELRKRLWVALLVLGILYAPLLYWNKTHHWMNFVFTVSGRGFAPSAARFADFHALRTIIFAVLIIGLTLVTVRSGRKMLVLLTALPLIAIFVVFSFFQNVETYWFLGPFASLCVSLGPWIAERKALWSSILSAAWVAAALYTAVIIADAAITRGGPLYERNFVYQPLAQDVQTMIAQRPATPLTDIRGIAATLAFNGLHVLMTGAAPQVPQWQEWYGSRVSGRVLFVTNHPVQPRSGCTAGPLLNLRPSATSFATFYTEWCIDRASLVQTE